MTTTIRMVLDTIIPGKKKSRDSIDEMKKARTNMNKALEGLVLRREEERKNNARDN